MPLIHSKRPAAFKHNIETEMEHGKPQKQAVAIAYKEAGEHKAKGGMMCAHGGPVKCAMGCYSGGGPVKEPAKPKDEDVEPDFDADDDEIDGEDGTEIHKALGEELSRAIDSKDHKGMHDSIEAIIENCLSKKGGM